MVSYLLVINAITKQLKGKMHTITETEIDYQEIARELLKALDKTLWYSMETLPRYYELEMEKLIEETKGKIQ